MVTAIEDIIVKIVNVVSLPPQTEGLPEDEKIIFFGRINACEYCIITIPDDQENDFNQAFTIGEGKIVQATIYHGGNLTLRPYSVAVGQKTNGGGSISDSWFCRAKNPGEYKKVVWCQDGKYFFNGQPFEKIFHTF
ncbi:MAG: hypothetical protein PHO56_05200 [Patescibacteria group bacterium]|nr:hypothetical protein [Patescibacteria group bacterium]